MSRRSSITAIVLAGGRSSRFGSQKLAAELDGATLLEHALRAVEPLAGEIVVAGNASPRPEAAARPIRVVADDEPFAGPLAALAGALRAVTSELAIVVGGDMPGLVPAVLEAMVQRLATSAGVDAVLLQDPTHRQVLPLAIRVDAARLAATDAMAAGDRSLVRFIDRLRPAVLPAGEWRALDPAGRTVDDVDEPADLDRLRAPEIR